MVRADVEVTKIEYLGSKENITELREKLQGYKHLHCADDATIEIMIQKYGKVYAWFIGNVVPITPRYYKNPPGAQQIVRHVEFIE